MASRPVWHAPYLQLLGLVDRVQNRVKTTLVSDRRFVEGRFRRRMGYALELDPPRSFSQKLQWRNLFERDPIYTRCSDKYEVRSHVAERVGEEVLVPVLGVYDSAYDIDFDRLPGSLAIKATHASGWNVLVREGEPFDRAREQLRLEGWLKKDFYPRKREWRYRDVRPRLVVEELLLDEHGEIPADYKFHVFEGGAAVFVQVDSGRFGNHTRDYFDERWNRLPLRVRCDPSERPPSRPDNLPELLRIARRLAEDFSYVRVDLYSLGDRVYFGELTFTPGSAFEAFEPRETDFAWGELFEVAAGS